MRDRPPSPPVAPFDGTAAGLLVDLHSHSRYSDGTARLCDIESACERRGFAVALTDHNEVRGAIQLADHGRVLSLPAIEVGTREGLEFLIYFPDAGQLEDYFIRTVEPRLLSRFMVRSKVPSLQAIEEAQGLGGYVSLAHPFAPGRKSIDFHRKLGPQQDAFIVRVLEQVNAIELFNGGVLRQSNVKAGEFSLDIDKPVTAGSDSHHVSTLGSCGIRFSEATAGTTVSLFNALAANQKSEIVSRQGTHFRTVPIIALKHTLFFVKGRRGSRRDHH